VVGDAVLAGADADVDPDGALLADV